jgi:hypothetical protein
LLVETHWSESLSLEILESSHIVIVGFDSRLLLFFSKKSDFDQDTLVVKLGTLLGKNLSHSVNNWESVDRLIVVRLGVLVEYWVVLHPSLTDKFFDELLRCFTVALDIGHAKLVTDIIVLNIKREVA